MKKRVIHLQPPRNADSSLNVIRSQRSQITVLHTDSPDVSDNEEEGAPHKVSINGNRQIVDYRGMKMTLNQRSEYMQLEREQI